MEMLKQQQKVREVLQNNKDPHIDNHLARKTIKEKEKAKRMKGQSSHHTWKPEAFMLLRQQFD